jgi:hypothetical protein
MQCMGSQRQRAAALLGGPAAVGIAADVLLRARPAGANVFAVALVFVGALTLVLRVTDAPFHQGRRWMALPLVVFAALFMVRDSRLLTAANLLALAGAVSLGALRRSSRPATATIGDYAAGLVSAGAAAFAGTVVLLEHEVPWRKVRTARVLVVARGAAIAAPFILVFGALFLAADAVFRHIAASAVPTTLPELLPHLLVVTGVTWLAAGLLRDLAAARDDDRLISPDELTLGERTWRVGGTELAIALACIDLLFLAFVIVQARYLFGGRAIVLSHHHLTYAQYARHGFFELLAVSALVVPVVLAANALVRSRVVRALSVVLILLELAVAGSALQRMHVYVDRYGLTELRIYVTGVTLWIAVVLVWAIPTVVVGNGRRFAVGALVAGLAATLALNVANPDALIVRTNIARGHVDPHYLAQLGDDAVPSLVARLPAVTDPTARRNLARALLDKRISTEVVSWNASRSAAAGAIARHRVELRALAGR